MPSSSTLILTDLVRGFLTLKGELDGAISSSISSIISSSNALPELEYDAFFRLGTAESTIISLHPEELEIFFDFGVEDEELFGVLDLASPLSMELSAVVLAF